MQNETNNSGYSQKSQSNPIQQNQTRPNFHDQIPISIRISNSACSYQTPNCSKIRINIKNEAKPINYWSKWRRILNNSTQIASKKQYRNENQNPTGQTWFTHLWAKIFWARTKTNQSIYLQFSREEEKIFWGMCKRSVRIWIENWELRKCLYTTLFFVLFFLSMKIKKNPVPRRRVWLLYIQKPCKTGA